MKLILGLVLITSLSSFGQELSEGNVMVDNKVVNTLSTHLKADQINSLIGRLQKDLGPESENNSSGIAWFKIEKPDWAPGQLSIRLTIAREGAEMIVLISCASSKGKDLLRPQSDSQKKIMEYFREKLTI